MSFSSQITNAKGVAADGRLLNVRTRHVHLTSLFQCLEAGQEDLVQAALASFPKYSRRIAELSVDCIFDDITYEAARLDEKAINKAHSLMAQSRKIASHRLTLPLGTVAVAAYNIQSNPIGAIFGPLVASIASGNAVVVMMEDGVLASELKTLFRRALDREAYSVVTGSEQSFRSAWSSFDRVVSYSAEGGKEYSASSNILSIPSQKSNLFVVEQSLVSESVYREKNSKPSAKQLKHLQSAVDQIVASVEVFPNSIKGVLVSENILPLFKSLIHSSGSAKAPAVVVSCRSTEHIIEELKQRNVDHSSLYIYASLSQAAYLSRFTRHKSCVFNGAPVKVLINYIPSEESVQLQRETQSDISLKPIWSPDHFATQTSSIGVPFQSMESVSNNDTNVVARRSAPFMKRRKPKHLEFFPTGFKITAFPALLTLVGLAGYGTIRTGIAAFHIARYYYERR